MHRNSLVLLLLFISGILLYREVRSLYLNLTRYKGLATKTVSGKLVTPVLGTAPFRLSRGIVVETEEGNFNFMILEKELAPIVENPANKRENNAPARVTIEFEENQRGEIFNANIKEFSPGFVKQPK
jgi:hypothetical protein